MQPLSPACSVRHKPQVQFPGRNVGHPTLFLTRIILEMQNTCGAAAGFPQETRAVYFCAAARDAVKPAFMPITAQFYLAFSLHTAS
jgi:hypothetical protein